MIPKKYDKNHDEYSENRSNKGFKWHSNPHDDDHNDHRPPSSGGQGAKPKKPKPSAPSGGRAVSITPGESLIKAPEQGSYERTK